MKVEFDEKLDAELRELVQSYPKNFISVLNSTGAKGRTVNREYLRNYIARVTPLLADPDYTMRTKLYWVLNHIESWDDPRVRCKNPKCHTPNGTPYVGKNIKKLKDGYVRSCCKQCERDLAQATLQSNMLATYGVTNPFLIPTVVCRISEKKEIIADKKNSTRKKNGTFKVSEKENEAYRLLVRKFPDLVRSYKCPEYPFVCDFFVPAEKLFIEFNGTWTHGGKLYDPQDKECQEQLERWKTASSNSAYYTNAIETWTVRDVKKREIAKQNNLNYKIFWNLTELREWLDSFKDYSPTLLVHWDRTKARIEKKIFDDAVVDIGKVPLHTNHNYIVKYFQQDLLYTKEKEFWKDPNLRQKLIDNRCKFLGKTEDELTDIELLDGFKKSGIYYGYSLFNPMLFKWFTVKYNAKVCYDPCGGWGHRLLGSSCLDTYLYNDKSANVKANVDKIIKYFKIKNCKTTSFDAREYVPSENFDSMFTCPPYFNIEHYECGDFKDEAEFKELIDKLFEVFNTKASCKTFGLVIREDMLYSHDNYIEKFQLTIEHGNYLTSANKINKEFLFIFKKS